MFWLLLLFVKEIPNIPARMALGGFAEDEIRGAWGYARGRVTSRLPG